jgi:hypothetical protein
MKSGIVGVTQNSADGSNLFELQDQRWLADVARVKDVFNAPEKRRYLRIEEVVGIGDDADAGHEE